MVPIGAVSKDIQSSGVEVSEKGKMMAERFGQALISLLPSIDCSANGRDMAFRERLRQVSS